VDGAEVVLVFVRNSGELGRELPGFAGMMRRGSRVWVLWPKKASGEGGGLTMPAIRQMAAEFGLVDYKVCAVDATWSALMLAERRRSGARAEDR